MGKQRYLVVTADDFGIGPATSRGILDLGREGAVTATVLLVNSPHAEQAVHDWNQAGRPVDLGWHPCLTLDRPVLSADLVPSLVDDAGRFLTLGVFLRRWLLRKLDYRQIAAELLAQHHRFLDLVGQPPALANMHHHLQVFPPLGRLLRDTLREQKPLPYLRRIREPWTMLPGVPGARLKRIVLSYLGKDDARRVEREGFPGNEWLVGITDPPYVSDPCFLQRWLRHVPGEVVELTCHPGYRDETLLGRDATPTDGQMARRQQELDRLRDSSFRVALSRAGFTPIAPSQLSGVLHARRHAA